MRNGQKKPCGTALSRSRSLNSIRIPVCRIPTICNMEEAAPTPKNSGSTAGRKVKALSGVPSGLRIIRCWNCRKKVQDQLSIARRIWGISAELRISTGFFTRSGCWKCRRRQKRNSPCRRRYKKRRKNKVSAKAGLDNH